MVEKKRMEEKALMCGHNAETTKTDQDERAHRPIASEKCTRSPCTGRCTLRAVVLSVCSKILYGGKIP